MTKVQTPGNLLLGLPIGCTARKKRDFQATADNQTFPVLEPSMSSAQSTTPARTALLALHYQNEVLHPQGLIRVGLAVNDPARSRVVDAAAALLAGARRQGWPIVHVRIAFRADYRDCPTNMPIFRRVIELGAVREHAWGSAFFDPLAPCDSPQEFVVTHTRVSAFAGTSLEQTLRLLEVHRLVIAGVATHSVVEGTARDAADRGFDTWIAADACAAAQREVHEASLASMALIATVSDVPGALAGSTIARSNV